jgi:alcohol dehydrogenase YqhD (iron-dependent ADH family)
MFENLNDEIKKEIIKKAVDKLEDPWKNLTVKDVAKDLKMGENKTNELFNRDDFPSVNIGKTKTISAVAFSLWKLNKRTEV